MTFRLTHQALEDIWGQKPENNEDLQPDMVDEGDAISAESDGHKMAHDTPASASKPIFEPPARESTPPPPYGLKLAFRILVVGTMVLVGAIMLVVAIILVGGIVLVGIAYCAWLPRLELDINSKHYSSMERLKTGTAYILPKDHYLQIIHNLDSQDQFITNYMQTAGQEMDNVLPLAQELLFTIRKIYRAATRLPVDEYAKMEDQVAQFRERLWSLFFELDSRARSPIQFWVNDILWNTFG